MIDVEEVERNEVLSVLKDDESEVDATDAESGLEEEEENHEDETVVLEAVGGPTCISISDPEIWRIAGVIVEEHAQLIAEMKASQLYTGEITLSEILEYVGRLIN